MRKQITLLLSFLLCAFTVFAQNQVQNNTQEPNLYGSPNTPIDNTGHWEDMAERGVVKRNPVIPVKPATEGSSMVLTPKGLQNSPDVLIIDVGTNVQSENSVFVDPNNRDHALNSNNSGSNGANYILTDDGGLNWAGSTAGAGGTDKGDPAACIGLNGRHYIGAISSSRKQVVSYSDNGTTWTKVNVESGSLSYPDMYDKNHLWIDNTNSGQEGNVYNAWTNLVSGDANNTDIEFTRSTNDGLTWSTPYNISNSIAAGSHNQGVNIQCNNTGWVFAVWAVYDDWGTGVYNEDAIGFARSSNGGASFLSANRIVNNIKGIRESASTTNSTGKNMRVNSFPSMAIDVSGGPNHGNIYIVWANIGTPGTNTGTNVSVYMVKSTNGGTAWSTPSRINTVAANNHAAYMPWITCDPVTGNLYTIFYDDRNFTDASTEVEAWVAFSDDGGTNWTDMSVSDVSFTPAPIPGFATGYFGDYLGISAYDGKVYPVWTDNRSGRALAYTSPLDFGCSASSNNTTFEYISNVSVGSINNPTGSDSYTDYTAMSTDVPLNGDAGITVTNGEPYTGDQCGIWIDWNRDDDFDDADETIIVSGPDVGPYTATIDPPPGTTTGTCLMRVRVTYTGTLDPCGASSYGEVEDYTINVTPNAPNEWIGVYNYWWHNDNNWSLGHIPTTDEDVVITSAGYQPPKCDGAYVEECNNLTIETGGTLNMVDGELTTNGSINISGTLGMIHDNAEITCHGNIAWDSGSSANITASGAMINAYGNWNFNTGANANLTTGFVDFKGTSDCWIRAYSSNSSFYNLRNYKSGGAKAKVSNLSTNDLVVNNLTFISSGAIYESRSNHDLIMRGSFNYYGTFDFTTGPNTGSVVFDGTSQSINNYSSGSGVFNNTVFSSSGTATLSNVGIDVMGDLTIESGTFNSNGLGVEIHGNWNNTGGTYTPTGSTVTFNGNGFSYPQDVDGTNAFFNVVQLNTGSYLRFNDPTTIQNDLELHNFCWTYDGMAINGTLNIDDVSSKLSVFGGANVSVANLNQGGGIVVSNSTLTVNEIIEGGTEGSYTLLSGEINLTKTSSYLDFNGDITIEDGQFVINSSNSSYWTFDSDLTLTMPGGILDFNTPGCYVYNGGNTLTLNITGGTIRTAGYFYGDDPDFTPSAGLLEFYSTNDAVFRTQNGCSVFDVLVNKNTKSGSNQNFKLSERDIAAGIKPGSGNSPLANQISLTSDVDINGDFTIDAGVFNTSTYNMTVARNWTNNVGDGGFLENTNLVTFDSSSSGDITTDETFFNMNLDKTYGIFDALELNGITLNVLNDLDIISDPIEMNTGSTLDIGNDIHIASNAGLNAWSDTGLSIFVGGNWTNDNTEWDTYSGYSPDNEVLTFDGSSDQIITTNADREDFGNLVINMSGGEFRSNDSINVMHDFTLTQGTWHDNANDLTHFFQGNFYIAAGAIAIWNSLTGNTVVFKGIGDQTVFNTFGAGYFKKVIIDKTDFAKKKNTSVEGSEIAEIGESAKLIAEGGTKGQKAMMVNLTSDLDIQGGSAALTIEEGILNLNGNTFWTMGDININDGGKLIIDDGALLKVNDGDALNVNSGGFLEVIGSTGNNAKITNRNTGFYDFSVKPGGTISANEATFEDLGVNGVYVNYDATIDPANAFTNCTFRNGSPGFAGLLGLNSNQTLTLTGLNFPANTGGTDFNIWKLSDVGNFTIEAATGVFMGPEFEYDNYDRIHWGDIDIELDLTVLLEGPFNGTDMNTDLRDQGVLPLSQPFNVFPYFYTGSENVASIPPNVVDWVLFELRDADSPANADAASTFEKHAAFILNDGSIVNLDGSSPLTYTTSYNQMLYPVIIQLNHLAVISGTNLQRDASGVYAFNFTNGGAFGGAAGQKEVSAGVWAMFGGDGSGDGNITTNDITNWEFYAGNEGYLFGDYNLDSQADNKDKNDICVPNIGKSSQVNEPEKASSGDNTRITKD